MKKNNLLLSFLNLIILLSLSLPVLGQSFLDPSKVGDDLLRRMETRSSDFHPVTIYMADYVDVRAMDQGFYARKASLQERTYEVITALKAKAAATQGPVLDLLDRSDDVRIGSIHPFWITNVIHVDAKADAIAELSNRADVLFLDLVPEVELDPFTVDQILPESSRSVGGHEPGHSAINATGMWALGYTGYGRVAMGIDTGVDPTHPALSDNWRGNFVPAEQAWFEDGGGSTPNDCDNHGSHTMGTMVGLDRNTNDTIGVAFNGLWIASPGICGTGTSTLEAFQWAMDPDNNPSTTDDMPDAINNSWFNSSSGECSPTNQYKLTFDALEAVGIAVVFSAGNSGPGISTITSPKNINTDLVNVFSVGNLNGNVGSFPINSSSSRGPSICADTGSLLIKPEVSAPGTQVRSSIPGPGYANFTGTSMAAPHVCGAILLLKEAFPNLTGSEIKLALYFSATDLGTPGEDNDYGMGIIDVVAAYNYLVSQGNIPVTINSTYNVVADAIVNITDISCTPFVSPVFPISNQGQNAITSATIHYAYSNGGPSGMIPWTGNLLPGGTQPIVLPPTTLLPGEYTLTVEVELPASANEYFILDNNRYRSFTILEPSPATTSASVCLNSEGLLTATTFSGTGDLIWYDALTGGSPVGAGSPFITPPAAATTTYYVDVINQTSAGEPDNTTGTGSNHTSTTQYLIFDCYSPFTLDQVTVYSNAFGNRNIELRNSNGTLLQSVTVSMGLGQQDITLGFQIMPGTDYRLATSGMTEMYRHSSGTSYPYTVPGVLSIKNSSAGSSYYYYYYDWQISYSAPCGRTPATVSVVPGTLMAAFTPSASTVNLAVSGTVSFSDITVGATSWLWDFGDGNTSTQQNPSHTYTQVGSYLVTLVAEGSDGCSDLASTSITVENSALSIGEDLSKIGEISIFPNPSEGLFTLGLDLLKAQSVQVSVFDLLGKEVSRLTPRELLKDQFILDLTGLGDGIYYVRLDIGGTRITRKIVKTN